MLAFDNGATSKIDDVLTEDGGLLDVLPLTVHLSFFLLNRHINILNSCQASCRDVG